ncbi:MAG: hypothetical protein NTV31_16895 [Bacteroidia bacterium]|nr:hypothetical protein [Bacteroidia bacterium]
MKNILLIIIVVLIPYTGKSQGLTKKAEGESSILFKGTSIEIDIGKTQLSFGFNNLNNTIGERSKFFLGTSVTGENKEGISNLFSKGHLVPSVSFNGYSGYAWSNGINPNHEYARKIILSKMEEYDSRLLTQFKDEMRAVINTYTATADNSLKELKEDLLSKLGSLEIIDRFGDHLKNDFANRNENIKIAIEKIGQHYDSFINIDDQKRQDFEIELETLRKESAPENYWQFLVFGFGGISATEFKSFVGFNSTNLSNSFQDQYFRGGRGGLGMNFQYKNITLGATYSYLETNNFPLLSKNDYSWRQSITRNNQTLVTEKKITAYSGSYGKVAVNELNFDISVNLRLDKESKNHLLINPYLSSQLFSRNKEVLPNSTNIGCGFYFFQQTGKFLGGVYLELTDVNQNYENKKSLSEQNLNDPIKRMSFGIVGKMVIGSLLNLF